MIQDAIQARREIFQVLADAWVIDLWAQYDIGVPPPIRFEGRDYPQAPDPDLPYTAIFLRPAIGKQSALANGNGKKKWEEAGTLWIQCFGPLSTGGGLEIAEYQSIIAARAYQGESSDNGIWFRNVRKQYIGPSGGWYQINVLADYEYDELR